MRAEQQSNSAKGAGDRQTDTIRDWDTHTQGDDGVRQSGKEGTIVKGNSRDKSGEEEDAIEKRQMDKIKDRML